MWSFAAFPPEYTAATQSALPAALCAMIADTMIPEAFAETHDAAGLIAGLGFLSGFALSHGIGVISPAVPFDPFEGAVDGGDPLVGDGHASGGMPRASTRSGWFSAASRR